MNFKYLTSLCAALLPATVLANGDVTGKVINKDSGAPMDFVTVQLIDAATGKALPLGGTTEEDGSFIIKGVKDGKYVIKISNIGSIDRGTPCRDCRIQRRHWRRASCR